MNQKNENLGALENQSAAEPTKKENFFKEIIKFALLAAIIVLPIRLFIAQPFVVSGRSMDPTFANGQYLIVDEISYRFENPKRGDVIIFKYPMDKKKFFIKRIIGLPLETIEIRDGQVTVKNEALKQGLVLKEPYLTKSININERLSMTLKSGEYFVMGDNRNESLDSRVWGPLKFPLIIGKPFLRLFPVSKISFLPGKYNDFTLVP